MSNAIVAVARAGFNVETSTDPNDFIFHSSYNTLKILSEGNIDITIPHNTSVTPYTMAHNLQTIPLVMAFMREGSLVEAVFENNLTDDASAYLQFESVTVNYTQVIFNVSNANLTTDIIAHFKYYIFEVPL